MKTQDVNSINILEHALCDISMTDMHVKRRSAWWRTPAYPPGSGPEFINGAAIIETKLTAEQILLRLHDIEAALGRVRVVRWAPRVVDLDLLGLDDQITPDRETVLSWMSIPEEEARRRAPDRLLLPHPRLHERAFVLAPLAEIAPEWRHPVSGLTVAEMLAALPPSALEGLERLETTDADQVDALALKRARDYL